MHDTLKSMANDQNLDSNDKKNEGPKNVGEIKRCNNTKCTQSQSQCLKLEDELKILKEKFSILIEEKGEFIEKLEKCKSLGSDLQKEKKENAKISALLEEISKSKLYKKNESLRKEMARQETRSLKLKEEINQLKIANQNELKKRDEIISELKQNIKKEQTLKAKYKKLFQEKSLLLDCNEKETESDEINLREAKYNQFSDNVRLTVIALMGDANVAAQNCSKVIQIVAKHLFNKNIKIEELPSTSTVLNISSEAFHVAHAHVVEKIKDCNHFTFSSDETSRQKRHFLERHIVLDSKRTLSLGFTEIARDDASTLLEKTIEIFDELSEIYCHEFEQEEKEKVLKEIIRKMKGMMSDRASVMKSYNKKMLEHKKELVGEEESIEFMYCNAHFLLGLVTATEKSLSDIEKEMDKLGRDKEASFSRFSHSSECAAFRAIRLAAEVLGPRGDEKSGCREEWLNFCHLKGKRSKFTSYRTNRFNNLFENAFALIEHCNDVVEFLSDYCSTSNLKLQSILADVKDSTLMSIVLAIAIFFVNFTNPYWHLMNSSKSYLDFCQYVKKMQMTLNVWTDDAFVLSNISPIFDDFVESSQASFSMLNQYLTEVTESSFKALVKECKIVFERQLCDFLGDGVYSGEMDLNTRTVLDSCPLTNLTGERLFGDFDYDLHKRRNASLHLRTTMNMLKRNKTVKWLQRQKTQRRHQLIVNARRNSAILKKKSLEKELIVRNKIKEKMLSNLEEKKKKEIEKMERKAIVLNSVLSQGGLCSTKEDLDNILKNKDALVRLKDQIKFRKYVLGERISYTGSIKTLYTRLLSHLGYESEDYPTAPQSKRRRLY